MSQLSFPFHNNSSFNSYKEEDFLLLSENSAAFNFLGKFFAQNDFASAQIPSLILKGEKAGGKTHLLNIFAQKYDAEFLNEEKISDINLVNYFFPNKFYILDDANKIKDEELLLHLINAAFENNAFLILALEDGYDFKLKDLTSRLKNIITIEIKAPSLESIKQLLQTHLSRRQIKLSRQVIDFIANNIKRNYLAALEVVKMLELHIQERGKSLNMSEIKSLLQYS